MTVTAQRHAAFGLALAAGLASAAPVVAQEWEPNRPVEMVIMAGQGGGADRLARLFQTIIQKESLASMPFLPTNKGGGSGAEALRYLVDNAGNPHIVMATLNSYYTTPLQTDIGVNIEEFTPLARMAVDTFVLWVNADSGIETLDDYVAAVKDAGGAFKMGGTGTGQEDSLVTAMLENAFDIELHLRAVRRRRRRGDRARRRPCDSTVNNPSEALSFFQAGRVKPIAAFTPERIAILPDVPTMSRARPRAHLPMQRSFVAPPGMPEEAQAYYVDLFTRLHESEEWQTYAEEQALITDFLTGDELQAYFLEEREKHAELARERWPTRPDGATSSGAARRAAPVRVFGTRGRGMLRSLTKAETLIALGMMALALYFMVLAAELPIGWNGETQRPRRRRVSVLALGSSCWSRPA
jgi:putative tricarboxylic transport membrane protein